MENEIKVGEFIRTKDGRIYQVDSSNDEWALSDIFYKVIKLQKCDKTYKKSLEKCERR